MHGAPLPPPRGTKVPEEIHRALLRGLAADPDRRFPSMMELLDALALEQGDHAAGRTQSRNRLLKWFVGMSAVGLGVLQIRQAQRNLSPRDMLLAAGLVLCATLFVGLIFRKTLLDNRFHRYMWFVCVVNMTQNAAQRLIAIRLGIPMIALLPFEMIVLAANSAIVGAFLIPWLRWLPVLSTTAAVLAMSELVPLRLLSFIYPILSIVVAIGWIRAEKQPQRTVMPADAGTSTLPRNHRTLV